MTGMERKDLMARQDESTMIKQAEVAKSDVDPNKDTLSNAFARGMKDGTNPFEGDKSLAAQLKEIRVGLNLFVRRDV